jgi:hypothetical protein
MEAKGITVEVLHYDMREAELLPGNSALSQCGLRYHPNILNCLYAPSIEDVTSFASQLAEPGVGGVGNHHSVGHFLSSVKSLSVMNQDLLRRDDDDMYNSNAARSFQHQHHTFGFGSGPEQPMETS